MVEYVYQNVKGRIIMANPTMEGLNEELESYERELDIAEKEGDEDKVRYLQERIRRVNIEIENLKRYNSVF